MPEPDVASPLAAGDAPGATLDELTRALGEFERAAGRAPVPEPDVASLLAGPASEGLCRPARAAAQPAPPRRRPAPPRRRPARAAARHRRAHRPARAFLVPAPHATG